jgi:hypothetical protein
MNWTEHWATRPRHWTALLYNYAKWWNLTIVERMPRSCSKTFTPLFCRQFKDVTNSLLWQKILPSFISNTNSNCENVHEPATTIGEATGHVQPLWRKNFKLYSLKKSISYIGSAKVSVACCFDSYCSEAQTELAHQRRRAVAMGVVTIGINNMLTGVNYPWSNSYVQLVATVIVESMCYTQITSYLVHVYN